MNIKDLLHDWAEEAIEVFNSLSSKNPKTPYYTQSPLDKINHPIDTLVLGINPSSSESKETAMKSPDEFLCGNENWRYRFQGETEGSHVSSDWAKYFGNAHFMLCGDQERHNLLLDNDEKTVWANLTPFATTDASKLTKAHFEEALPFTARLIKILKPRRIILLSTEGLSHLNPFIRVERLPLVRDTSSHKTIEIGTIDGIPAIQLSHPSRDWGFPKYVIPMIVQMHKLHAVEENNKSLDEVAAKIKYQLSRIEVI